MSRVQRSVLFASVVAIFAVALLTRSTAALGPAVRATRIDPVLVLKHEAGG
jgi:ABC-type lipoprotein release transport system permease subunit